MYLRSGLNKHSMKKDHSEKLLTVSIFTKRPYGKSLKMDDLTDFAATAVQSEIESSPIQSFELQLEAKTKPLNRCCQASKNRSPLPPICQRTSAECAIRNF